MLDREHRAAARSKKRAPWKRAFLVLLAADLLVVLLLFVFLTGFFAPKTPLPKAEKGSSPAIFTVQANKKQLETLINESIQANSTKKLNYRVSIGNQVELKGSYRLLFTAIPFSLSFSPQVSGGDVILRETSVKIGSVRLPDRAVLGFLKSGTNFPKWVLIQPQQRQVYLNLTKAEIQDGFYLRAKSIDLPHNVIAFTVHQNK
jgi:uncharacterized protein YpmS